MSEGFAVMDPRCNKLLNEGRHVCRFPAGHEGECHPHINASPAAPLSVDEDPSPLERTAKEIARLARKPWAWQWYATLLRALTDPSVPVETEAVVLTHEYDETTGRVHFKDLPAAPLSTLPERPEPKVTLNGAPMKVSVFDQPTLALDVMRAFASKCDQRHNGEIRCKSCAFLLKACDEIELLRSRLSSLERELDGVRNELESERKSEGELWDERTRLRDALFTIRLEVVTRRVWSDVCEKAMARALLPLGTPGDPVSPSALRERSK